MNTYYIYINSACIGTIKAKSLSRAIKALGDSDYDAISTVPPPKQKRTKQEIAHDITNGTADKLHDIIDGTANKLHDIIASTAPLPTSLKHKLGGFLKKAGNSLSN